MAPGNLCAWPPQAAGITEQLLFSVQCSIAKIMFVESNIKRIVTMPLVRDGREHHCRLDAGSPLRMAACRSSCVPDP